VQREAKQVAQAAAITGLVLYCVSTSIALAAAMAMATNLASVVDNPGAQSTLQPASKDHLMMLDWNEYQQQLHAAIGQIAALSPDTVRGYRTLSDAGSKTGKLDGKTRELIALAVAVTLRCDGCITTHTSAAIKAGASREEISEALGVAISVNAGAALVYSARVMDAYAAKTG
jgi:AhpD family alkylhydroperoxidase